MARFTKIGRDDDAVPDGTAPQPMSAAPAGTKRARGAKAASLAPPASTAQRLGGVIKSARDIMRKDKGLNGDMDRLPMLTWMLFLKFLDDRERGLEEEAAMSGSTYTPVLQPPYRWRDWADQMVGLTGPDLIRFIENDEADLPDGSRGPGLFAYLRNLRGSDGRDRRDVIASVFRGTRNRMESGYLLRDVVNRINDIDFQSSDGSHTLGHLYESMLREMRDAAGDGGEFYTPRAVVKFMVEVVHPDSAAAETVLDPACGTGGFLVAAYEHMWSTAERAGVEAVRRLQTATIFGNEAKSLPYMLAQMNLLLHGIDEPRITIGNSLNVRLGEIGEKDRVDVILTNPPFGGEEERGILDNFPFDKRTAETALLFLQLIMAKLKRPPRKGRAAVVVPNGTLFATGVAARIKQELLEQFNLHTGVRLPNGLFAPYTGIPTNILFFDRSGPTREVWFYEQPLPEGRKNYSKTQPIQFDEFAPCIAWWNDRQENERAWRVPVERIAASGYNLDLKNPNAPQGLEHLPPLELVASIRAKEHEILSLLEEIEAALGAGT